MAVDPDAYEESIQLAGGLDTMPGDWDWPAHDGQGNGLSWRWLFAKGLASIEEMQAELRRRMEEVS